MLNKKRNIELKEDEHHHNQHKKKKINEISKEEIQKEEIKTKELKRKGIKIEEFKTKKPKREGSKIEEEPKKVDSKKDEIKKELSQLEEPKRVDIKKDEIKKEESKVDEPKKVVSKKDEINKKESKADEPKEEYKIESKVIKKANTKNSIGITIEKKLQKFNTPETNLEKAEEMFTLFLKDEKSKIKTDKEKFKQIEKVIEICEINPKYNFYYLKYFDKVYDKNNKDDYNEDKEILAWSLTNEDYSKLYNSIQSNPINDIFELLNLCGDESKFSQKAKTITYHSYNIPLIKANEKFRENLYRHRISKISSSLQKKISYFKDIIVSMETKLKLIDINESNINLEIYLFILCLLDVNMEICKTWFETYFKQILTPKEQISINQRKNNFDIYLNYAANYRITVKDIEKDEFIIKNNFESITFTGRNYVLNNLITEFSYYSNTPLNILLKRNESFEYFSNKHTQIIDDEEIFLEFKNYFNLFIHSPLLKEVLRENHQYIIELIESNSFPGLFFDDEYVKSFPLYYLIGDGYTDKDIVISFITYFPIIIKNFGIIKTKEQYENIKNVFFLFDVCYKFITSLHEILIHLCYGYINYITEGKIGSKSPKSSKNKNKLSNETQIYEDGGKYFEELLFGTKFETINLQLIYTLLNGEYLNKTLEEFKNNLKLEFDPLQIKMQGLFGKILRKYKIDFTLFEYSSTIGNMRKRKNDFLVVPFCKCLGDPFYNIRPKLFRKDIIKKRKLHS